MQHIPVLLHEVVDGLCAKQGDVILDATVGGGGHSEAICRALGGRARFICLDADQSAIERSRAKLSGSGCEFSFFQMNFRRLDEALAEARVTAVNRAVFDLGLSSFQLDAPEEGSAGRGFSFRRDEPLEMTFSGENEATSPIALTARRIVNEWSEETLTTILQSYGEERHARSIAARIVEARAKSPITTSGELARLVESLAKRRGRIHPATKTFQAIRMAVNDEYAALKEGIGKAWDKLASGGRLAVISFHSIEDRLVKDFFREKSRESSGTPITKKPLIPGEDEVARNPRGRSAKLRIIEKL